MGWKDMNGQKNNQTSTGGAATAGILVRLRSLISPARLINSMPPAMAGEPVGAVEAAEGWRMQDGVDGPGEELRLAFDNDVGPGPGNVAPSHAERLLRSACDLLCSQPITLISATSLILPPEPGLTTHQMADLASLMAIEYGLLADVSVNGDHVHVRLTRRIPRMPTRMRAHEKQFAAPISVRGPRKGRN
jgi:hypothetical protein